MKNPLTILVVEDRENHIADCQAMFEELLPKLPIQVNVLWAKNLLEATSLLPKADAVMTDVFFPATPGGAEEGNGKVIVERSLAESKPVVWVTSTYHHGGRTDDLNNWGRAVGMEMFDCDTCEMGRDGEAPHKPWELALCGLVYTAICVEQGWLSFANGKLVDPGGHLFSGVTKSTVLGLAESEEINQYPLLQALVETAFPD